MLLLREFQFSCYVDLPSEYSRKLFSKYLFTFSNEPSFMMFVLSFVLSFPKPSYSQFSIIQYAWEAVF